MATHKFRNRITRSTERARAEAFTNGRGRNSAFTGGARTAQSFGLSNRIGRNGRPVQISEQQGMVNAWDAARNGQGGRVATYGSSRNGRMSVNGRTAGGSTWTFTQRGADGALVRQSGRNRIATRRQRYYDVRRGLGMVGG